MASSTVAFIIFVIACWIKRCMLGNQLPHADQRLYAKSIPTMTSVRNKWVLVESNTWRWASRWDVRTKQSDTYIVQELYMAQYHANWNHPDAAGHQSNNFTHCAVQGVLVLKRASSDQVINRQENQRTSRLTKAELCSTWMGDIRTRQVHFVTLSGLDHFLLSRLDLQRLQFLSNTWQAHDHCREPWFRSAMTRAMCK